MRSSRSESFVPGARGLAADPDRTAADGLPLDRLLGGPGPAVEPGPKRGVGEVVPHRHEGDRVVGGIGRGNEQVVEVAIEVEIGPLDEPAPVGQEQQELIDGRDGVRAARGSAQAIQAEQRDEPRALRSMLAQVPGPPPATIDAAATVIRRFRGRGVALARRRPASGTAGMAPPWVRGR